MHLLLPLLKPLRLQLKPQLKPQFKPLRLQLLVLLRQQGPLLLGLNGLRAADRFSQALHRWRLSQRRSVAQGLMAAL